MKLAIRSHFMKSNVTNDKFPGFHAQLHPCVTRSLKEKNKYFLTCLPRFCSSYSLNGLPLRMLMLSYSSVICHFVMVSKLSGHLSYNCTFVILMIIFTILVETNSFEYHLTCNGSICFCLSNCN